jgi:integrase
MASIIKRKKVDGSVSYQVMIRVRGERPAVSTFETEQEARAFIGKVEPKILRNAKKAQKALRLERAKDPSYAEFLDMPMKELLLTFMDAETCKQHFQKSIPTIVQNIDDTKVRDLSRAWCRAYIERMSKKPTRRGTPYMKSTIHDHFMAMAGALNWMGEELDAEPPRLPYSAKSMLPNKDVERDRRLPPEDEARIRAVFDDMAEPSRTFWHCLMSMALETAARMQELIFAEWSEFDLDRRVWAIPKDHTKMKRARAVPLSNAAMAILEKLQALRVPGEPRVFHRWSSPNVASNCFRILVERSGVEDFRFHDCRHEAASRMVLNKRKLSTFEIMGIVGHKDSKMLTRYANLRADELVDRMD